jgi:F-type H+-transporting ATPase subunit c
MHDPMAFFLGMTVLAAAIALFNGAFTTFGQARVASQAIESMARQPEAADSIRSTMFIGLALCETSGIYGLLIAMILLFANPLINVLLSYLS